MSDLRERVAVAMKLAADDPSPVQYWYAEADAAIAIIRAEVLDEAARAATDAVSDNYSWNDACSEIVAAIRALKDKTSG